MRSALEKYHVRQHVYVSKKGQGRYKAKALHGQTYKGPAVYDTFDPEDSTWPHYVLMPDGDSAWFSDEDVTEHEPVKLPKVPKFASVEEAEAWLEKHQPE